MRFLKQYLVSLICGLVIILAVVALFWPLGPMRKKLQRKMKARLAQVNQAHLLSSQDVMLPGHKKLYNGVVTHNAIALRHKVQNSMIQQMHQITAIAARINARDRVQFRNGREVPLLDGIPETRLLPAASRSYARKGAFARDYTRLFSSDPTDKRSWLVQLNATVPPTPDQIKLLARQRLRTLRMTTPRNFHGGSQLSNTKMYQSLVRAEVLQLAATHQIYASRHSFQIRSFIKSVHPPGSTQIFNAFVDCWLQADVVHAIRALNAGSPDVAASPVKRLVRIRVGPNLAQNTGNSNSGNGGGHGQIIFALHGGTPAAGAMPGAAPAAAVAAATIPTLTEHLGTNQYDVTFMRVNLVVEPSEINRFIDALYKQSNAYTVLNVNLRTVDPIDSITSGYAYGPEPVVDADITVEAIFFRHWTQNIMPASYRKALALTAHHP